MCVVFFFFPLWCWLDSNKYFFEEKHLQNKTECSGCISKCLPFSFHCSKWLNFFFFGYYLANLVVFFEIKLLKEQWPPPVLPSMRFECQTSGQLKRKHPCHSLVLTVFLFLSIPGVQLSLPFWGDDFLWDHSFLIDLRRVVEFIAFTSSCCKEDDNCQVLPLLQQRQQSESSIF
jgi:hypothetical protein